MTYRFSLAPAARTDIIDTLDWSMQNFGAKVREGYEALIVAALDLISEEPAVLGSRERTDLADDYARSTCVRATMRSLLLFDASQTRDISSSIANTKRWFRWFDCFMKRWT